MGMLLLGQPPVGATGRMLQNAFGTQLNMPYKNFAKNSVSLNGVNSEPWPGYLDANQYPCQNPTNNIGFTVQASVGYADNWVVSFTGIGEIVILAASTTITDIDSCVVAAGGNTKIRSNTASEARGTTRVVIHFNTPASNYSFAFPGGSTKYSNVGGAGAARISSMQNLIFCRATAPYTADEGDINSGDLTRQFNQDSLAVYATLNPRILRFMGMQSTNDSCTSKHSTRTTVGSFSYFCQRFDPTLWVGAATNTGNAYSCTASTTATSSLVDGEQVQVQFTNAQLASVSMTAVKNSSSLITCTIADTTTLGLKVFINIPGISDSGDPGATSANLYTTYTPTVTGGTTFTITTTGSFTGSVTGAGNCQPVPQITVGSGGGRPAKPIYGTLAIPAASFFANNGVITAGMLATLTYDALIDVWLVGTGVGGLNACPPVEVVVALCNKMNKDMWWCFPCTIITSEAITQATYIRDNLRAGLNVYFEYGNEVWNGMWVQNKIVKARGFVYGFSFSSNQATFSYWAQRYCEIMKGIGDIWSGSVGLKRTLAFQGAGDTTIDQYLFTASALKSTSTGYWAKNPVDWSATPPTNFCEIFSYGMYYYGCQAFQFDQEYTNSVGAAFTANAAYYAGLTAAADAFAGGDTSQVSFIDDDVRWGTFGRNTVTIAADGTFTVSSGTNASNGVFAGGPIQVFVSGGTLPSPLTEKTHLYYPIAGTTTGGTTFKVSATPGGSTITTMTGGSGTFSVGETGQNLLFWNTDRLNFWNAYAVTYNKQVVLYEAAQASWFPSTASCTTIGISTAYSQKILNLVIAYQQSSLLYQNVLDQMNGFMLGSKSYAPGQLQDVGLNAYSLLQGFTAPTTGSPSTFLGDILCAHNTSFDACAAFDA